jgi:apolipoprotein N-acyltransferase
MKKLKNIGLPLLGGFLYALGFPSHISESIWIAPIIGFALLFYRLEQNDKTSTILKILSFSAGFNLLGFYWIPETIHTFGELPLPLAYFLGLFFSLIILPQLWAYVFVRYILFKNKKIKDWFHTRCTTKKIIINSLVLTILEYFTPQQFPAHIGHGWAIFPGFIGLATTFGASLYSYLNFLLANILVELMKTKKLAVLPILICVFILILSPFDFSTITTTADKKLNVRVVQANIGNFMKVHAEQGGATSMSAVLKRYLDLSTQSSQRALDLIIWPETAFPYAMKTSQIKKTGKGIPSIFNEVTSQSSAHMLFGGYDRKEDSSFGDYFETEFNSAIHINESAKVENVYHKQVLIPFGETLPMPTAFNTWFSSKINSVSFFAKGAKLTRFELKKSISFITPICYEILYSDYIYNYVQAANYPDFIVNMTNDSWYGDTMEPHQHLFLAKWRAIEFGMPIIRSTNTGITSVIYPDLSESKRLKIGEQNILDVELDLSKKSKTLFARFGMSFNYLLWILSLLLLLIPKLEMEIPLLKGHEA